MSSPRNCTFINQQHRNNRNVKKRFLTPEFKGPCLQLHFPASISGLCWWSLLATRQMVASSNSCFSSYPSLQPCWFRLQLFCFAAQYWRLTTMSGLVAMQYLLIMVHTPSWHSHPWPQPCSWILFLLCPLDCCSNLCSDSWYHSWLCLRIIFWLAAFWPLSWWQSPSL